MVAKVCGFQTDFNILSSNLKKELVGLVKRELFKGSALPTSHHLDRHLHRDAGHLLAVQGDGLEGHNGVLGGEEATLGVPLLSQPLDDGQRLLLPPKHHQGGCHVGGHLHRGGGAPAMQARLHFSLLSPKPFCYETFLLCADTVFPFALGFRFSSICFRTCHES